MAILTPSYATPAALTITLLSLATSANLLAGQESTQVDNTTNKYDDAFLEGFITVGTTPTAGTRILVFAWGSNVSLATTAKDTLVGTNGARTISSAGVQQGFLKLGASILVDSATSNRAYPFGVASIANLLGLPNLPAFWGVFVTHSSVSALNNVAGNHAISWSGIKYDIA